MWQHSKETTEKSGKFVDSLKYEIKKSIEKEYAINAHNHKDDIFYCLGHS